MSAKNTDIGTAWGTSYFNIPGTNGTCSLCGGQPNFQMSNMSNLGNQNRSNPFEFRDNTYVSAANLTWIKGKHSTRYGLEFDRFASNHFQPQNTYGPRGSRAISPPTAERRVRAYSIPGRNFCSVYPPRRKRTRNT
jgi:hypothetical protein